MLLNDLKNSQPHLALFENFKNSLRSFMRIEQKKLSLKSQGLHFR